MTLILGLEAAAERFRRRAPVHGGSRMPSNQGAREGRPYRRPAGAGLAITAVFALSISAAMAAGPARGKVVAVDKRTGRAAWEAPLWSRPEAAVSPLVTPELVYVLEEGKALKALDPATGRPRWQTPLNSRQPLTLAGEIVIALTDQTAIALNRWNGKRVWEFDTRLFGDWKFDAHTIPVVAPGRVLLPARQTVIGLELATGQPAWAYTVTAATAPLQPVVVNDLVYIRPGQEDAEIALSLADGLPDNGEHAMPPDVARAIARTRKAAMKALPVKRPATVKGQKPFVAVRATVAPGGKVLAAAGAKRWRFIAPPGWTIDRVTGESAGHLYALLGGTPAPAAAKKSATP